MLFPFSILGPEKRYNSMKGKKYKKRTAKADNEYGEDVEEDGEAPFALAGLYVLKVILIDMTISLGDVGTDFWQVIDVMYHALQI